MAQQTPPPNLPVVPDLNNTTDDKKTQIANMFNHIAHRYDLLNRIISMGIDQKWRQKALQLLEDQQPKLLMDVATGTGDFALMAMEQLNPDKIVGIDIADGMLDLFRKKLASIPDEKRTKFEILQADAENLPFADNNFDAITVAFGVRNFANLPLGLANMWRVLKPGGSLVILELTQPPNKLMRLGYNAYNRYWLPFIGKMLSKNNSAYTYLPASIRAFPQGNDFINHLKNAQFTHTRFIRLTFGICTIYFGKKPI
ncbi:MAG: bifunctional demethylmenaquinone methyltransferase/2-methoxy-6-polyprenyl-1,4-benzoquinol methylase UbiE [Sphingobacteriales bacterium]|jgi:demethylmenaquinone methyltransferase/2-methoxy-6-polyprenyl-1,4-benzoquinol methylase|nr:bifunctional demethylmenaquinone methyltransferase/2-methoxy-6-polyprenyl-1,4-benzoquinol methylase UbiE [Sphingobacteriales bacterium]MBP9141814.1 bifunctional demethylmenaquinone methyltransferase/2-methoxy-6-polyprenyl-1,4-benzoquinol methylase UbiE [Chitinophagales bacterium]MDA0198182.1 bifunctional demethylmenaquinone methyltransferase/2-methoxy-6-polyprenyl-1,4-benzoquinol methylase UbiE [Bacteroidota bacterium]MBK6889507.1 bifunctional demethylmenaquinone methyltransferase/2-methoxy-6